MNVLRQLLADVQWGSLDFLLIDLPPGTGDEPLSLCQLIPDAAGAVVVTTPQELSLSDVRRCINFCRTLDLPVLGVIENMSGFVCPHCGRRADLFGRGGGRRMAQQAGVPFLGHLPIDPAIAQACDEGKPFVSEFPDSEATRAFLEAIEPIRALAEA
jgi:Mrp family chromosome partitioning ATPase